MARPNYGHQKRQKELAKQKKQEEKRLRRQHQKDTSKIEQPGSEPSPADESQGTA